MICHAFMLCCVPKLCLSCSTLCSVLFLDIAVCSTVVVFFFWFMHGIVYLYRVPWQRRHDKGRQARQCRIFRLWMQHASVKHYFLLLEMQLLIPWWLYGCVPLILLLYVLLQYFALWTMDVFTSF
jgi:hypothetical protein